MHIHTRLTTAALMGFVLIAASACGGGGGLSKMEEEALQERVEEAEQEAEEQRQAAEEAERQRQAAERAAAEAAEAERQAERDAQQAEEQRQAAVEAEQAAEEARLAAEAEQQRLEAAAEVRRRADALERARTAIAGNWMAADTTPGTLAVGAIVYGEPVPVTTPQGPFTTSTGRSGSWATTSLTSNQEPMRDMVQIYTDVEAPARDPFSTSPLNTGNVGGPERTTTTEVIDSEGDVVGWVNIDNTAHSLITAAGSFPRQPGPPEPFSVVDRGLTQAQYDAASLPSDGTATDSELAAVDSNRGITRQQYNRYRAGTGFRNAPNTPHFPERYAYTTGGQLQGASGTYRCNAANTGVDCTVQNNGGSFTFGGDWDFIPSSGTVRIVVPDAEYMWFGVWAQQTVRVTASPNQPTEIWAFEAQHGGNAVTGLAAATGSATYEGPAIGRYAVYEPDTGESGIGSFTASAALRADFGDGTAVGTVSGTITDFSNDSSWSLGLQQATISGGTVGDDTNGVTWTIDGNPDDSGAWEAQFYNNLPTDDGTVTYQPHGIAGTFEATYDPSGVGARAALIGAFGAHR